MEFRQVSGVAHCLGCGCHDYQACESGCWWLRVDYTAAVGVCSECEEHVERWDAGDRNRTAKSNSTVA
jgi:hypothetical protein